MVSKIKFTQGMLRILIYLSKKTSLKNYHRLVEVWKNLEQMLSAGGENRQSGPTPTPYTELTNWQQESGV
jgi:hypothetical protein